MGSPKNVFSGRWYLSRFPCKEEASFVDSTICPFTSADFIYPSVFNNVHQCVFDCDSDNGGDSGSGDANSTEDNSYHSWMPTVMCFSWIILILTPNICNRHFCVYYKWENWASERIDNFLMLHRY